MKIFVDSNVILDVLEKREPFFQDSNAFLWLCTNRKAALAPHTLTNIFYKLQKRFSEAERKSMLLDVLSYMDVVQTGKPQIVKALHNDAIGDFEDGFQLECAREYKADFIVTRDLKPFANSGIKTLTPKEFLEKHGRAFAADGGMKTLANEGGK